MPPAVIAKVVAKAVASAAATAPPRMRLEPSATKLSSKEALSGQAVARVKYKNSDLPSDIHDIFVNVVIPVVKS